MSDSFCAFHSPTPKITTFSSLSQPYCICTHCNRLLTFYHHVAHVDVAEQRTSDAAGFHVQSQQSSRWSPTSAQLLVLEELYRQGMKTPTAEQIQQIASHLRRFGKVEGKNVFYWFQNHKARERQKRRQQEMEETAANSNEDKKEKYVMGSSEKQGAAGWRGTGCEVKETKKWASTSNCSGHAEESSVQNIAEKVANGWTKFEERGIQVLRRNIEERQAKCQNMEMPCFTTAATTSVATSYRTPNGQLLTPQNYSLPFMLNGESFSYYEEENADPRTLELFPLKRDDKDGVCLAERKSKFCANASMGTEISSKQFFEFLPLRY